MDKKNVDVLQQLNVRHSVGLSILRELHKDILQSIYISHACQYLQTFSSTKSNTSAHLKKKNPVISCWWRTADQGHVLQSHSNNFGVRRNFLEAIMLLAQDRAASGSH